MRWMIAVPSARTWVAPASAQLAAVGEGVTIEPPEGTGPVRWPTSRTIRR